MTLIEDYVQSERIKAEDEVQISLWNNSGTLKGVFQLSGENF